MESIQDLEILNMMVKEAKCKCFQNFWELARWTKLFLMLWFIFQSSRAIETVVNAFYFPIVTSFKILLKNKEIITIENLSWYLNNFS